MPIVIRIAEAGDVGRIASMQFRSENEVEFVDKPHNIRTLISLSVIGLESVWAERVCADDFKAIIAIDDDSSFVCGVIGLSVHKGIGYIRSLYIAPGYLRLGIGTALMKAGLNYLLKEGCTIFRLEVLQNNVPAMMLYRKFNFKFKRFFFPEELGGTAQALFPNNEYRVRQMQTNLADLRMPESSD